MLAPKQNKNKDNNNESLLTIREVCEILHCHPNTLRKWDNQGILVAIRLGNRSDRRYRKKDVLKLLEEKPPTQKTKSGTQFARNNLQQIYASIIETSDDAIFTKSLTGIITSWNIGAENLFGYNAQEIIGESVKILMPPDHKNDFLMIMTKLKKGEKVDHFETKRITKNGRILDISVTISPLKNALGKLIGASTIARDITQRKKSEETLRESEKRFRLMADGSPIIIWVTNPQGHLQFVNKTYCDYFGITLEEQVGDDIWKEIVYPDDAAEYTERFHNSLQKHEAFIAQARVRRADGNLRWIESRAKPRFSTRGKFLGYIGISPDITDYKLAEQQKDEFLSIASHELKTPVTSIKAYGQILEQVLKQNTDAKSYEILVKLGLNINKLTALINDLLDISRIQAGKLKLSESLFDFNDLVKEVVEEMQRLTKQHKIIKKLNVVTTKVFADRNRIEQVLINLISNAVKYSPSSNKIIVSTNVNSEYITFSVKDFGLGIPKESQTKIFERFYRINSVDENSISGLGIGLYISNEIIKSQKGNMWFESKRGKGSTFYFRLPIPKQKLKAQTKIHAELAL